MGLSEEMIRRRAYEIWEQEGRPSGTEHSNWYQAVRDITEAAAPTAATLRKTARTSEGATKPARARKAAARQVA